MFTRFMVLWARKTPHHTGVGAFVFRGWLALGTLSFKDGWRSWAVGAILGPDEWPTEQVVKLVGVVAHPARADVVNFHLARLGVGVQRGSPDSVSVDDLLRGECSHW
jgi:hypothetical protein